MTIYEEFLRLKQKSPRKEVVQYLSSKSGLSLQTLYSWFKGTDPLGKRSGKIAKVPELLYVIGALLGDGCIFHWRGNFQIWLVGDEAFTAKFATKLAACLGRRVDHYKYGSKNAWFARFGNAELFFLIQKVRKDPTLVRKLVEEVGSERSWLEFVEGFFDAEGCVKIISEEARKTPKVCLDVCNTDLGLLAMVKEATIEALQIEMKISRDTLSTGRKRSYHLRIYKKESIRRFLSAIPTTKLTEKKRPLVFNWLQKVGRESPTGLSRVVRQHLTN